MSTAVPFPSQVRQDGWVRAEHLAAAIAEHLGAEVAAQLLHQVQVRIGMGEVRVRYADDVEAWRSDKPNHFMGSEGRVMGTRPLIAHVRPFAVAGRAVEIGNEISMDWPTGLCGLRCSYAYELRVGRPPWGWRDETEWLPIGPVELPWLSVVALLPQPARKRFLPTERHEKAKWQLNQNRRLFEKIESAMRKHVAEQLGAEPNSKPPPKRWLITKTIASTECTQDQAEVVYGTLPDTMKLRHGGQKSKRAKNAGG
jgi:hypothetical protein